MSLFDVDICKGSFYSYIKIFVFLFFFERFLDGYLIYLDLNIFVGELNFVMFGIRVVCCISF